MRCQEIQTIGFSSQCQHGIDGAAGSKDRAKSYRVATELLTLGGDEQLVVLDVNSC